MAFNPFRFLGRQFGSRYTAEDALGRIAALARQISDIPTYRSSLPVLAAELTRARRYERESRGRLRAPAA